MRECIEGCQFLRSLNAPSDELQHCLYSGIVTAYTRSFTQCEGLSKLPSTFTQFPDESMGRIHTLLCGARRYIYGHKDMNNEASIFDYGPDQETINRVKIVINDDGTGYREIQRSSLDPSLIDQIQALAEFQERRIESKLQNSMRRIATEHNLGPGEYTLGKDFPPPEGGGNDTV